MDRTTVIYIIVFVIVGGIMGWLLKGCTIPAPVPIPPPTVIHDTTYTKADTVKIKETHYVPYKDTSSNISYTNGDSISDNTHGVSDSVAYDISHTIIFDKDSIKSVWDIVILPPPVKTIIDSVLIHLPPLPAVTVDRPFYANIWFYATVVVTAVGTYALYVITKVNK
jgi:hypothetical protein